MKKNGRLLLIVMVLVLIASFTFASGEQEKDDGKVVVGLSWDVKNDALIVAWEDYLVAYSEEYGKEVGLEFEWIINVADGDPSRQAANIEDFIVQNVDIILCRPKDGGTIGSSIKAAKEAGIPIVTFDHESQVEPANAHVGASSYELAYDMASAFAKMLKENNVYGKVIELHGDMADQNAIYFHEGFVKAEEEFGAWETLTTVPTEWNPEKCQSGLTNALKAYPEANVVFIASDFMMDAVRAALEQAGRYIPTGEEGHVWICSMGATTAGLPALEQGYLDIAGVWDAWYHSRKAVEVLAQIALGEEMDGERFLVSGRLATPDNVNDLPNLWSRDY